MGTSGDRVTMFALVLLAAVHGNPTVGAKQDALQGALDQVTSNLARHFNFSVFIATAGPGLPEPVSSAHGIRDRYAANPDQASPTDLIPGGSITKALTATLCLQLAEAGTLDLDRPVHTYIDPWLVQLGMRQSGSPLPPLRVYWGGPNATLVNNITARQLLSMQAGLRDYDDQALILWSIGQTTARGRDFEPLDFLLWGAPDKTLLWAPGSHSFYSGIGYVILGLVLASVTEAADWDQLNQAAVFDRLPAAEVAWYAHELQFMKRGPCSQYGARVIPQYLMTVQGAPEEKPSVTDWPQDLLRAQSCLNGWTMGNILTSAAGLARFYADLHTPGKLLTADSLRQMLTFAPLTIGEDPPAGTPYGLGQMKFQADYTPLGGPNVSLIGHGGEDYGSGFPSANWIPELNLSLAIGVNLGERSQGMNTSLTRSQNGLSVNALFCRSISALSAFRGGPQANCSQWIPSL